MVLEGFGQGVGLIESVGREGLFDKELEELLDDRLVDFRGCGQEVAELFGAIELDLVPEASDVGTGCIDGFAVFLGAKATDGVVVFESESEGIDDPVAGLAHCAGGLFCDALACRQARIGFFGCGDDRIDRWSERTAQDSSCKKHTAVDRRARIVVGVVSLDEGVRQDACCAFGGHSDFLKRCIGWESTAEDA